MGLDCERVPFCVRMVPAKFRSIPSAFDPSREGSRNLRKLSVFLENFYRRDFWVRWKDFVPLINFFSWLVAIQRSETIQMVHSFSGPT